MLFIKERADTEKTPIFTGRFDVCEKEQKITACAVLCCAVLCCAVLCCAVLCCAVLCCAVLCCAVLCCAVLCCAVLIDYSPSQFLVKYFVVSE
ncbi:hypothetical protein [Lactococcus petauri]|uniref:hypothetical protein n=1 Tax=Lactococcus petauri TaxID=1940789 RepID=UPI0025515D91|nr:hypothetical protein [Lactococcus petauri]